MPVTSSLQTPSALDLNLMQSPLVVEQKEEQEQEQEKGGREGNFSGKAIRPNNQQIGALFLSLKVALPYRF